MKIRNIEIQVTSHCNLNCKSCDHFSPIANKWEININDYNKELALLKKYFNVEKITIIGGEPLLHTKLKDILINTRKNFLNNRIVIFTNGTLIKEKIPILYHTMKKYNIEFQITKYPIKFNYDDLINILNKIGIRCYIENYCDEWFQYHIHNEKFKLYENCHSKESVDNFQLVDNKLFCCQLPAYIKYFNCYFNENIKVTNNDYLDLSLNLTEEDIKKYIENFKINGIDFCKQCHELEVCKWGISKKEIEEWK